MCSLIDPSQFSVLDEWHIKYTQRVAKGFICTAGRREFVRSQSDVNCAEVQFSYYYLNMQLNSMPINYISIYNYLGTGTQRNAAGASIGNP